MTGSEATEEMESVSHELLDGDKSTTDMQDAERGETSKLKPTGVLSGLNNLAQLLFSPVFLQTFIMTFLAEWGDRSQVFIMILMSLDCDDRACGK